MEPEKTAIGYESVIIAKMALIGTSPSGKVANIFKMTFVGSTLFSINSRVVRHLDIPDLP